ncbi:MAG: hypothetical protein V1645_01880 [archaeon]
MLVSFFEEFPERESLANLDLVSWPTKLYLAAGSFSEFRKLRSQVRNRNVKEVVYWPILHKREGYWISPFSRRKALLRVFSELDRKKVPVLVDAELPTTQNPLLYFTQSFNFFRNKRLICDFVKKHDSYVAEYYPDGSFKDRLLSVFGLHFDSCKFNNKVVKMVYHSMHDFDEDFIRGEVARGLRECGDNFIIGLGTIAEGVSGDEPILSVAQLKKDLGIAEELGVNEVIIYRLGGLNKEYCSVIKRFL